MISAKGLAHASGVTITKTLKKKILVVTNNLLI